MGLVAGGEGLASDNLRTEATRAQSVEWLLDDLSNRVGQVVPMRGEALRYFVEDTPVERIEGIGLLDSRIIQDFADDPQVVEFSGEMRIVHVGAEVGVVV